MITSERMQEIMREVVLGVEVSAEDVLAEEVDFRKDIVKDVKYFTDLGKEIGKPVDFNWTLEMPDLD